MIRSLMASGLAASFVLAAPEVRAERGCAAGVDRGRFIGLEVQIEPPDGAARQAIERHVATELGSSGFGVCASASGSSSLAEVHIHAVPPDLVHARIAVQRPAASAFDRELRLDDLPLEARPLAIASATHELLRSVLAQPEPAPSDGRRTDDARVDTSPAPTTEAPAASRPLFELGLAGIASTFIGRREALGADLMGRLWLTPAVMLSARIGAAARLSRPDDRGIVQASDDLHAALGAGLPLLPSDSRFGLIAEAHLGAMRVGFDEQFGPGWFDVAPWTGAITSRPSEPYSLDHGWAFIAALGTEGRYRAGAVDLSATLNALIPIIPATSDWAETTSIDRAGFELRLGVWVPLARTSP
jgi:hypothetical protein